MLRDRKERPIRFIGSEGNHGLELEEEAPRAVRLRHELITDPMGIDRLVWSGSEAEGSVTLLDGLLPEYEFGAVHRVRVSTPPERALEAVQRATLGEMPLVRPLFGIRSLPASLAGRRGLPADRTVSLYEQMGRIFVLLAEHPGREVVVGGIGQMWRPGGGIRPAFRDVSGFVGFGETGYAKVAMSFSAVHRDDRTELRTETRVLTTDSASRRAFERYWRVIRPWSGLIGRRWLRAARRRAERGAPSSHVRAGGGAGPQANDASGVAPAVGA